MDKVDAALLRRLEEDARQSYADLGRRVGLSKTPCWHRVQELEAQGVIRAYRADLDPQKLGLQVHAFVQATIDARKYSDFEVAVQRHPSVLQCFTTAGAGDYLLHVLAPDIAALDGVLREEISRMPGVQRTVSTVCMKTIKHGAPITGCLRGGTS
ncbi:MAG TPA: Lrp/AsnC family transcriptional regulator [Steroidobacteraceae bacterium]|nr:Lrp/AsnC family transcriptional regulator [Steroidobacteraceae bacterium]